MKILQTEIVNTGGGCLALDITLEAGSIKKEGTAIVDNVKSIVFSDTSIVAYDIQHPFDTEDDLMDHVCWEADSLLVLQMAVGERHYKELIDVFKKEWPPTVWSVAAETEGDE